MTFTDARARIATALNALEFLTGHPYRPSTLKPGTAYPLFDELVPGPGQGLYGGQWRVIVILGQSEKLAEPNLVNWTPQILEAIRPEAFVDRARAIAVPTDQGEVFALEITARSE